MDQNKVFTKILLKIKRVIVVVLVLLLANSCAATETTKEPSYAVPPPPKTEPKISTPMVVLLVSLLTAFLFMCIVFFYFCYFAERQLALAATIGYGGQLTTMKLATARGLDPAVIATFTTFTYSTVKDIKIGKRVLECAVCLNEYHDHEALRLLPECNHVFHRDCIDEWFALHVTCPVCRASLVPKPSQLSYENELTCGRNKQTKDHVSVEVESTTLKHDLIPPKKLSRSLSLGHLMVERTLENVDRYTLRLPNDVQNVLKNNLKTSLKSASANFVRGSPGKTIRWTEFQDHGFGYPT